MSRIGLTDWDVKFLRLAREVSSWSLDPSTKTGAVIVRPDRTVASLGCNSFPRVMPNNPEWWNNREEKYSRVVHCEINAQISAREPLDGYTLYTYPFACCDRCAVQMIQAGIRKFAHPALRPSEAERWAASLKKTVSYYDQCWIPYLEVPWDEIDTP